MKKVLEEMFFKYCYDSDMVLAERQCVITVNDALTQVKKWLKVKREEMFIDTVSTEDCEMSAVREETFEALLEDIAIPNQISRTVVACNESQKSKGES